MTCPHHTEHDVCERCPERYDTDSRGFVHRLDCKGRTPLRQCHGCSIFKPPTEWSQVDWFRCATCAPGAAPTPTPPKKRKKPSP